MRLTIPADSSFAHSDIIAWQDAWEAPLVWMDPPPRDSLTQTARFRTQRDIHAAVAAAQAISWVRDARVVTVGFITGHPPPVTIGDFVRIVWWGWGPFDGAHVLPALPVVAGDTVTVRYVQPDSTVWRCAFVAPGGGCTFDERLGG